MDPTALLIAILKPLWWLLPLLLLGALLKSPAFKGWIGEWKVRTLIRRKLDPATYREFSNVTVVDEAGETTQIDHVYVSPFGVLVIETKNMGHWIFGRSRDQFWTQSIHRRKVRFQNPLRQNYRHVKVLASLLELPDEVFKPIVVFAGDCIFKTEMPVEVRTCIDLVAYIRSIDARILSDDQVEDIASRLLTLRLKPSHRVHREHVASLRRRHSERSGR